MYLHMHTKNAESSIILMITEPLLSIVLARLYCIQIVIEISSNQTIPLNAQTPKYYNENQLDNIVLKNHKIQLYY